MREAQKTLQNHVGEFHQNILGAVKGWENMHTGSVVDLVSDEHKVVAEVKNKHNTLSGGKRSDQYSNLEKLVMPKASRYHDYTSYFVTIIPRSPERFDRFFTPSEKETGANCPENALIREIDGASFYQIVTGEKDALAQLFDILPKVIEGISGEKPTGRIVRRWVPISEMPSRPELIRCGSSQRRWRVPAARRDSPARRCRSGGKSTPVGRRISSRRERSGYARIYGW